MSVSIRFKINGAESIFEVEPEERLVDTLRDKAQLVGTKIGCGVGECGACSVFFNGKLVPSCLVLSVQVDGGEVRTVEGFSREKKLSDLQQAFVDEGAVQCGYCTPGMLMAGEAVLSRYQRPTTDQIRAGISGNLCRCTGYLKIVSAIRKVARKRAVLRKGR
jgi:aerobic carbon-monoxide dehydrogenase small subunit